MENNKETLAFTSRILNTDLEFTLFHSLQLIADFSCNATQHIIYNTINLSETLQHAT